MFIPYCWIIQALCHLPSVPGRHVAPLWKDRTAFDVAFLQRRFGVYTTRNVEKMSPGMGPCQFRKIVRKKKKKTHPFLGRYR